MTYRANSGETPKVAILRVLGATALALALLLGLRAPASAQAACTTHAEVTRQLDGRYAESPIAIGLASTGSVVEVFASGDGSTWTIVMTMPNGTSCVVVNGEAWEQGHRAAPGAPA